MCLKDAVDDPLSGARFPAGPRTISGADALAFVRQRHGLPEGDLSRIRRQQVFLAAVADKVLAGGTLTDPAKLSRARRRSRSSRWSSTRAGTCSRSPARPPASRRATSSSSPCRPAAPRRTPGAASCSSTRRRCAPSSSERSAAREEAALARRGGGRRAGAGAPAAARDRGAALRRARAQRLGGERARRAGAGPAHRPRLRPRHGRQHRPTPRRRRSATATATTRPTRSPSSSAGSRSSRTTPCRPGTCRWCWAPTRPAMIPGLPAPTPAAHARRPRRRSRRRAYRASTDRRPFRRGPVTLTAALLDPYLTGSAAARPLLTYYDDATGERVELSGDDHRELGREGREPAARRVRRRAGHAASPCCCPRTGRRRRCCWRRGGAAPRSSATPQRRTGCSATPAGSTSRWRREPAGGVVALSLDAFGKGIPGLPAGVVDFAPEVRLHGDEFVPWEAVPDTARGAGGRDGGGGPGRRARAGVGAWASARTTGCSRRWSGARWTA